MFDAFTLPSLFFTLFCFASDQKTWRDIHIPENWVRGSLEWNAKTGEVISKRRRTSRNIPSSTPWQLPRAFFTNHYKTVKWASWEYHKVAYWSPLLSFHNFSPLLFEIWKKGGLLCHKMCKYNNITALVVTNWSWKNLPHAGMTKIDKSWILSGVTNVWLK